MAMDESLLNAIATNTATDKFAQEIRGNLNNSSKGKVQNIHNQFMFRDGFLFRYNLLYVPEGPCRFRIVKECHDDALAGHFGVAKTLELISRSYWWPQPWKLVKEFVKTCDTCARAKAVHHRPYGLLQPLPNPDRPWASISTDFITDLPDIDRFNSVLVVVDRFTKMAHFIPCSKAISGMQILFTFTVYQMTLSLIVAPNLCLISGSTSSKLLELPQNFRQPSMLRQTAKRNE